MTHSAPLNKETLIQTLKDRFEENMHRHPTYHWEKIEGKLQENEAAIKTLFQMEETGGEPDVAQLSEDIAEITFVDFSKESPKGRRSLCYDRKALEARKKHKPESSVEDVAREIGIELLTEAEYRTMQTYEPFDLKTSTWVATPEEIRSKGGAIFCDRRYDHVFTYHNGADSYYGSRGFRGKLVLN